jgi:hypothetical protein
MGKATRNSSDVIRIYSQIFAGIASYSPHKFDEISKIGIIFISSGYAPLVHKHPVSHLLLMCFLKLGSRFTFTIFNNEISCDNVSFRGYRFVTGMSLELNYGTYVIIRSHVKCGWVSPSGRSANHENLYHKFKLGDPLKKQIVQDGPSEGD